MPSKLSTHHILVIRVWLLNRLYSANKFVLLFGEYALNVERHFYVSSSTLYLQYKRNEMCNNFLIHFTAFINFL